MTRCFLVVAILTVACGGSDSGPQNPPPGCDSDIPGEFACQENPLAGDAAAIAAGQTLYESNCVVCHGIGGLGDGEEANDYDPMPSNLIDVMETEDDDYLLWRISEGGMPDTAMPSFSEEGFSRTEIWQVIAYLRSLP
jgi:mono/diheme cytochrome c family protein